MVEHSPQLPQGFTPASNVTFWPGACTLHDPSGHADAARKPYSIHGVRGCQTCVQLCCLHLSLSLPATPVAFTYLTPLRPRQ